MRYEWLLMGLSACAAGVPEDGTDTDGSCETAASCTTSEQDPTDTDDTDETDTGTPPEVPGTALAVTFAIDPDYVDNMDEAPSGTFYGQVFRAADVSLLGPDNDAVPLGDIYVEALDLPVDGSETAVLFELSPVPPLEIAILGFVDSDANADSADPQPDNNDPVTLPNQNKFTIEGGVENRVQVFFGFLNP